MSELVITIGEVIIHLVPMQYLQSMKQEHIYDHLRYNDDNREHQIVVQISLSNAITLRYSGFIRE